MAVIKHVRRGKISSKKKVFFEAQVYVRGLRVATKTFETRAAAEVWHDETKRHFLSGQVTGSVTTAQITFDDCIIEYEKEVLPHHRMSTRQTEAARLRHFKENPVSSVRMNEFGPLAVDQLISWWITTPTADRKCRKSFRHELKLLHAILNWYRNDKDASFTMPIIKRHREKIRFKQVAPRRPDYFMRPEEINSWISWLKEHKKNPAYHRLATFLVLTGCRVGEACGLGWDDIDLKLGVARITKTVTWDYWTKDPVLSDAPKTAESVRLIPLASDLISMFREMRLKSAESRFLFTDEKGGLLRYNMVQSAFNGGFVALGLPWRSTHICRHTNATLMLKATRDFSGVQANLGHTNRATTEVYAKSLAALDRGNAEKTAELIGINAFQKSQTNSQTSQLAEPILVGISG